MNTRTKFGWLLLSVVAALLLTGLVMGTIQAGSLESLQAGSAPKEVVVAVDQEPASLYIYGESSYAAEAIRNAIMDGPFDTLDFQSETTILTKVPSWDDGDMAVHPVTVTTGSQVVDCDGNVTNLAIEMCIYPAGCHNAGCFISYNGLPVQMDQIVVTYTLKSGILWSDGVTLTTQDSVFSKQIACDPDTPGSKYTCDRTESYVTNNTLTAIWTGLPGYMDGTAELNYWTPLPYHVLSTTTASDILNGSYGQNPLGWGPFKLTEWITGSHITMDRNPYYWREGFPKLDRITFKFMADSNTIYKAMLRGEIQLATSDTGVGNNYTTELLDPGVNPTVKLLWSTGTVWEHIDFGILPSDGRFAFFAEPDVRRAVAYALDRQDIIDRVYYGLGTVPDTYIPAMHPLYTSTLTTYPYSPTMAATLLTNAGWVDTNANGIRDKAGRELIITFTTTSAAMRVQYGTLIKEDLAAVGIDVNLEFLPAMEFFSDGPIGPVFGRKFDMVSFAWLTGVQPPCDLYLSSQIPTSSNGWGGQNNTGYSNPVYDAACEQALAALPGTSDYIQGQQTAQQILSDDVPFLPLFFRIKAGAVSSAFSSGPKMNPTENTETWNIWEWDMTTGTQVHTDTLTILIAPNDTLTGTFGSGTFSETTVVSYTSLLPLPAPNTLGGVARFFELEATAAASGLPITPQQPYTLTITYAQASVPLNVREGTLALYYWNGISWEVEPTSQLDAGANIITATPNHFSTWAVLGTQIPNVYIPILTRNYPLMVNVQIDGIDDWSGYTPDGTDPQGDSSGGPGTDLKSVYAEQDINYLYIMVNTYDSPLKTDSTIELNVNVTDQNNQTWWLHTNINSTGSFFAWTDLNNDNNLEAYNIDGESMAWGNVMEIKIPLTELQNPKQTAVSFVNFWTHIGGNWTGVDMMVP